MCDHMCEMYDHMCGMCDYMFDMCDHMFDYMFDMYNSIVQIMHFNCANYAIKFAKCEIQLCKLRQLCKKKIFCNCSYNLAMQLWNAFKGVALVFFFSWSLPYNLHIKTFPGAMVSITSECESGHQNIWRSSTTAGDSNKGPARINVLIASWMFLSGMNFQSTTVSKKIHFILISVLNFSNSEF